MNREVGFEAIWKRCTEGLSDKQIKLFGKRAIKKLTKIHPYDYRAGVKYCEDRLKTLSADKVTDDNRWEVFEVVYFYRKAKKPSFILTLAKKYLYC